MFGGIKLCLVLMCFSFLFAANGNLLFIFDSHTFIVLMNASSFCDLRYGIIIKLDFIFSFEPISKYN